MQIKKITKVVIDLNQVNSKGQPFTRMSNAEKEVKVSEEVIAYESEEGTAFYGVISKISSDIFEKNPLIYIDINLDSGFNLYEK